MSASLRWGVKGSLHSYIRGADGVIEVSDGASIAGDEISFPSDAAGGYRGAVRFLAHDGSLDWRIAAPSIDAASGGSRLRDAGASES